MSENILDCINKDGEVVRFGPLQPFLRTIEPAFQQRASEISFETFISEDRNEIPKTTAWYKKDGHKFKLVVAEGFHPLITSSRLKIMAGMSIALNQGTTESKIHLRFGSDVIDVNMQIRLSGSYETIILSPDWNIK